MTEQDQAEPGQAGPDQPVDDMPYEAARDELIDSVASAGASEEETLQIVTAGLLASPVFQWR